MRSAPIQLAAARQIPELGGGVRVRVGPVGDLDPKGTAERCEPGEPPHGGRLTRQRHYPLTWGGGTVEP